MAESQKNPSKEQIARQTSEDTENKQDPIEGQDLADRLKEVDGVSDDVAEQLAQNWQRLLGALVVVVLIVWAVNGYQKGRQKMLDEAAFGFTQAQTAFAVFGAESKAEAAAEGEDGEAEKSDSADEKQNSAKTAFLETMNLLGSNSGSGVYAQFAKLYQASASVKEGQYGEALAALQGFNTSRFDGAVQTAPAAEISSEQLVDEIAALMILKIRLLQNPDDISGIWKRLVSLAKSSQLVSVEAMVAALRISDKPERRAEVVALAKEIAALRPAYRDLIQGELQQYGIILDQPVQESA